MNNNAPVAGRTALCMWIGATVVVLSGLGTLVSASPIPGDSNMSGRSSRGSLTNPYPGKDSRAYRFHIIGLAFFLVALLMLLYEAYDDRIKSCVRKCLEKGPVTTDAIEMVSLTGNGQNVADDGGEGPSGEMNTQPTSGPKEGTGEEKGPDNSDDPKGRDNSNNPTSEHKKRTRKTKHLD